MGKAGLSARSKNNNPYNNTLANYEKLNEA